MKKLFKFRYPKTLGLIVAIILAYLIFRNPFVQEFVLNLGKLSYLGVFIAGILFSFGFTAPFSVGYFIVLNPSNIWLAVLIGGVGAMVSDLSIFKFIRFSFLDEFERIEKTKLSKKMKYFVNKSLGDHIRMYLMYVFAGLLIASPLPDEFGIIMLAGLTRIKAGILAIISFILNSIGIFILINI